MSKFVFWTGVYDIAAGIIFLFPGIVSLVGVKLPESNFWVWLVAAAVIYLGIALVLCSRDLTARASLLYWIGVLRLAGFFLFSGFGFFGDLGIVPGALGIIDLLIGLVYLIGLPRTLQTTAVNLLLDRMA